MPDFKIAIPEKVNNLLKILNSNGFSAYVVGGCVRDSLLGLEPNDWDICTSAKPEDIKRCFSNFQTFDSGIRHGTISVVIDKEIFEITTYRIDGEYSDNRHPKQVVFTDDITEDLSRRDFTVNAMAYNPNDGFQDPFNGAEDLKCSLIRCVGNPDKRFNEDALRIIRAIRFSSTYGFEIDEQTSNAVHRNAELLNNISYERICSELNKLLCGDYVEKILNEYRDVIAVFIPELELAFDFPQYTKHHNRDVWHHTTHAVAGIDKTPLLRMTMLLHDIGKPKANRIDSNGVSHFKGHPKYSRIYADNILHRLHYSNSFIEKCLKLITFHDVRFNGTKLQMCQLLNFLGKDDTKLLFKIHKADILAQSDYLREEKLELLKSAKELYNQLISANACYTLQQMNINGNDLKNIGITNGKLIGKVLNHLLSLVMGNRVENTKSALILKAKELKENGYV